MIKPKFNLQLFAEPGAANSSTGDPAQVTTPATVGTETAAPGKTYTEAEIEALVADKATKKADAIAKSLYQQNGMTEEQAAEAVKDFKAKQAAKAEADKGDLTKMQQKAADAEAKAEKVAEEAFNDLIEAKTETIAATLGIDPAKLPYIRLDFSKVGKDERGKPKAEDIKSVLAKALEVMPGIKATTEPITTGVLPTGTEPKSGSDESLRKAMGLPPRK